MRQESRFKTQDSRCRIHKTLFLFLYLAACFLFRSFPAYAGLSETVDILERIPVQHNGRIKPFQSFAEESVLSIAGTKHYQGIPAAQIVWNWIANPESWTAKPMIPVSFRPLRKEFSVMLVENKMSADLLMGHQPFLDRLEKASMKQRVKQDLSTIEKESLALYEKASKFNDIAAGVFPGWIPVPKDPKHAWYAFQSLAKPEDILSLAKIYPAEKIEALRNTLQSLVDTYRANPSSEETTIKARAFSQTLQEFRSAEGVSIDQRLIDHELTYDRMHPFGWAWKIYAATFVLLVLFGFFPSENIRSKKMWVSMPLFIAGLLIHSYGFYLRCTIAGRPPVTNMYESVIWVSWAICFFSLILFASYRSSVLPASASAVAAFALVIAETFPALMDPSVSPLVPVLRSNYWLTIHVLTITLSYGAFALAWGLGHVVVFSYAKNPSKAVQNKMLAQYLYRALQIGVILLAAGTVLGGVWANYSWGRFWGWDPKETWALIALLGYLAVLHGRFAGWLDIFGLAAASVFAFAGVVMAWYGVNFVLAAGLHSYGFGGGGAPYVLSVFLADFALILALVWRYRAYQKRMKLV